MNEIYEVLKTKENQIKNYQEKITVNDNAHLFPLGEISLEIIEALPFLERILNNKNSDEYNFQIYKYSKSLAFDISDLIYNFSNRINDEEINRLRNIQKYLELCSINSDKNNYKNLSGLVLNIFSDKNIIIKLLSLNSTARNNFTYYNSLSELVIISLFEIFDLGFKIYRCEFCGRFFIAHNSNKNKQLCERKNSINNFQGCKKYKTYINKISREEKPYIKKYRIIYARLSKRAKRNDDQKDNFEYFRNEWKNLWQKTKTMSESERYNLLKKFLDLERFK